MPIVAPMDPTKLPTDNLYKFLALAGLSLAGFCGWLIWKFVERQHSELAALLETHAQLDARIVAVAIRHPNPRDVRQVVGFVTGALGGRDD